MTGKIGVAISTRNRRELFTDTLIRWIEHTPPDIPIVVVDDASDEPLEISPIPSVRHTYQRGVAMTKNRCIRELMDLGCEHLFLVDDDVYPVVDNWWEPYVNSPEPHLAYQWVRRSPKPEPWHLVHDDGQHFSIGFPRGVMLYATRKVIETVGGMDPAYGVHGGEHVDWSQRIHDAGLTSWPYADVCGSERIWYAHDKISNTNNSTYSLLDRVKMSRANGVQWGKERPSSYVEYRENVRGNQDYGLGPYIEPRAGEHYALLRHILGLHPHGIALEFGVGKGESTRLIAKHMHVHGFDSFEGLPEDWRPEFPKGSFAQEFAPVLPASVTLCRGMFADAYPYIHSLKQAGLIHIDCDLYSSTRTVLDHLARDVRHLAPGTYIVFDEWHGYEGAEQHEQRAWREFAEASGISWVVVGHSFEQWGIRLV